MHIEIGDVKMARNMKEENKKFFCKMRDSLDEEFAERVPDCIRYISTNPDEKEWLKHVRINRSYRFARHSYALLLEFEEKEYICLINTSGCTDELPEILREIDVNAGLATFLGAKGFLTPDQFSQQEVYDKILYQTDEDYHGHEWSDIQSILPSTYCYEITLKDGSVKIRENANTFYWVLSQIAIEFNMANNPFGEISKSIWEKIVYEENIKSIQYKNIFLAYTALSWDISFLYLYQCLEDQFVYESVKTLYSNLQLSGVTLQDFCNMLYDELSWQPKDLESIEKIIEKCPQESDCIRLFSSLAQGQSLAKYIYSTRNRIVHETREAMIPLGENETWDKLIAAMLYLLKEI